VTNESPCIPEQRKTALRRIEMELDEADEMVSQMEIEIQGIPQALRPGYAARIKTAKAELLKGKKVVKDTHANAGRSELLGRGNGTCSICNSGSFFLVVPISLRYQSSVWFSDPLCNLDFCHPSSQPLATSSSPTPLFGSHMTKLHG
jgi:hypothetical protein